MKKSILLFALLLSSVLYKAADAQVHVNINIGNQPVWGPVGYDYVENYYFPDGDFYYNVPRGQYVYFDGRGWAFSAGLPDRCRNFDVYNSYKVVINDLNPYYRNDYYRSRYASFRNYRGGRQEIIYNSRDPRYYVINNHPEHQRWEQNRRFENDRRNVYNNPGRIDNRNARPDFGRDDNRNARPDFGKDNNRITRPEMQRNDNRNFDQRRNDDHNNDRRIEQTRYDGNRGNGRRF